MVTEEFINRAYCHANCFTSGIVFSEEDLVEFAKALLSATPEPEPRPDYSNAFTDAYVKMIRGE